MISLNHVIVAGNLTRDPELKTTSSNHKFTTMTIAINNAWKNKDVETVKKTTFINVIAWGNLAENCVRFLKKGRSIMVEGRIETERYEDKEGHTRLITRVNSSRVVFLENKPKEPKVESAGKIKSKTSKATVKNS